MSSPNVEDLFDFIAQHKRGDVLQIATSEYAMNTVAPGFRFDFWSTAPAVRSLIKMGLIEGFCGWRYYEVKVL